MALTLLRTRHWAQAIIIIASLTLPPGDKGLRLALFLGLHGLSSQHPIGWPLSNSPRTSWHGAMDLPSSRRSASSSLSSLTALKDLSHLPLLYGRVLSFFPAHLTFIPSPSDAEMTAQLCCARHVLETAQFATSYSIKWQDHERRKLLPTASHAYRG